MSTTHKALMKDVEGFKELPEKVYYHSAEWLDETHVLLTAGSSDAGKLLGRSLVLEVVAKAGNVEVKLEKTVDDPTLTPRYNPSTCTMARPKGGNYVLLYGGANQSQALSDILTYSPSACKWTPMKIVGEQPPAGHSFAATAIRDMMYLLPTEMAGCDKLFGVMMTQRSWHSLSLPWKGSQSWRLFSDGQQRLVFLGPSSPTDEKYCSEVHEYDVVAAKWSSHKASGTLPSFRTALATCVLRNRFVIMLGGFRPPSPVSELNVYDIQSRTWVQYELSGSAPLFGAAMVALDASTLVVFGGRTSAARVSHVRTLTLNPPLDTLFPVGSDPQVEYQKVLSSKGVTSPAASATKPAPSPKPAAAAAESNTVATTATATPAVAAASATAHPKLFEAYPPNLLASLSNAELDGLLRQCAEFQLQILDARKK